MTLNLSFHFFFPDNTLGGADGTFSNVDTSDQVNLNAATESPQILTVTD